MYSSYYADPVAPHYDPRAPPYQPRTTAYRVVIPDYVDGYGGYDHFGAPQPQYAPQPSPRFVAPSYAPGYEAAIPPFNGGFVRRPSQEYSVYVDARMREESQHMEMERMRHEERMWRDEHTRRAQWAAEEDRRGRGAMSHSQRESQNRARSRSRPPSPDSGLHFKGSSRLPRHDRARARSRSKARGRSKSRARESPTQIYAQPHPSPNAQSWSRPSPPQPSARQFQHQPPLPTRYSPPSRARSPPRRRRSPSPSDPTRTQGPFPSPRPSPKFTTMNPTPEMEAAAIKIQNAFRIHRSMKQLAALSSQFAVLDASFGYPAEVDYQSPSSGIITLRPSRLDTNRPSRNPAQARLAFTPGNRTILAHMEALSRLLVSLDEIESFGAKAVRERRKETVKAIENDCGELESWWRSVWTRGEEVVDARADMDSERRKREGGNAGSGSSEGGGSSWWKFGR